MSSGLYCAECGSFTLHPVTYDGQPYCGKCYNKLSIVEEAYEPESPARAIQVPENPVNVPIDLQKKLLASSFYDTVIWLQEMLDDEDFIDDLEEMAQYRLEHVGMAQYGSTMYGWDHHERFRNIMEELADVFVYKSSGDA